MTCHLKGGGSISGLFITEVIPTLVSIMSSRDVRRAVLIFMCTVGIHLYH